MSILVFLCLYIVTVFDEEYDFVVDYFLIKGGWYKNFILYMLLVRTTLTVIVKDYREMLMQYFYTSIPYLDMNSF